MFIIMGMSAVLITIVIVLIVVVLALLFWLLTAASAGRRETAGQSAAIGLLQQQLEAMKGSQDSLGQTLEKNIQAGQKDIGKYLQSSQETLGKLNNQIGQLQGSSQRILELGSDVRRLGDILKSPKMRGQLGEWALENLLAEVLPAAGFELQYQFRNGKIVDALAKMPDYSVPIDAKFPLPMFEAMIKAEGADTRSKLRRQFQKDVANHIDKIAASYINPDEGTLDFALMYIPAENVYYETIVKYEGDGRDILNYSLSKKVIPVSPNLLYAYLMTIVMGLHGLQIEKEAAQIRQSLGRLAGGFAAFVENWEILGKHLRNAQGQYDEGRTKLDRFTMQLDQLQSAEEKEQIT